MTVITKNVPPRPTYHHKFRPYDVQQKPTGNERRCAVCKMAFFTDAEFEVPVCSVECYRKMKLQTWEAE